jgi:Domain of unknown function (DUF4383)
VQVVAGLVGAVLLLVGIAGFIPGSRSEGSPPESGAGRSSGARGPSLGALCRSPPRFAGISPVVGAGGLC